jgi:hypothetical protein
MAISPQVQGRADMGLVSQRIKARLLIAHPPGDWSSAPRSVTCRRIHIAVRDVRRIPQQFIDDLLSRHVDVIDSA